MILKFIQQNQHNGAATFIFAPAVPCLWIAGQSIKIEVPGAYGPLEHRFTISAAPYEQRIAITTRRSNSAYKKSLFGLQPGATVRAFGVEGTFTWQESALPAFFVAGGIGITPMMSIRRTLADRADSAHHELVVAARTVEDLMMREEIAELTDDWTCKSPKWFSRRQLRNRGIPARRIRTEQFAVV